MCYVANQVRLVILARAAAGVYDVVGVGDRLKLHRPFGVLGTLCAVALFTVFRFRSSGDGRLLGPGRPSGPRADRVNFPFVLHGSSGAFQAG